MDLEVARKSLSKRSAFSLKKIAFAVATGLVLVAGIVLRASHYFGEAPAQTEPAAVEAPVPAPAAPAPVAPAPVASAPEAASPPPAETTESVPALSPATQEAAPVPTAPPEPAGDTASEPEGNAAGQAEQADLPGGGMILVSRKPVEVRSGPSASAPAMYGFPAGRPFRVTGHEGGFVRIQDLKSSASGWIDEAALAAPPATSPVAAPSPSKPGALDRKPATAAADPKLKVGKKASPVTVDSEPAPDPDPAEARRRPGLLGGLFGGIFGNGNSN
jgi:hypothetical protein